MSLSDDPVQPRPDAPPAAGANASGGVKVLVVDDDDMVRGVIVESLRLEGHVVQDVGTGQEAIDRCGDVFFDLVFVDLVMPKTTGLEVLKQISIRSPDTDVIVMTGYGTIEAAVESMKLGAVDFVTKPFSTGHLLVVVDKALERRRLIRAAREREYYKRLSRLDGLTELYNHRFFHQVVDSEVSRARRFDQKVSLLMLDIDRFKQYNDANGHPVGDIALKKVAGILTGSCRKYDFIARYGGEEFAILSPGTDGEQAAVLAERVRSRCEVEPFPSESVVSGGRLTISIGIATFPDDVSEKEELIERADEALYKAKSTGRNTVFRYGIGMSGEGASATQDA